jgi:hypothetical protein
LCPGSTYQVSFQAKRTTNGGTVSAVLYIDQNVIAGGIITATTFTAVTGAFTANSASAVLRMEFTYSGANGQPKEVQIDDVVLTKSN